MSQDNHDTANSKLPWDVIIHSSAGVLCLVIGGLMVFEVYLWATDVFSALMLVTFLSAIVISTTTQSWVRGHYLAMAPIVGIVAGYLGYEWGFMLAYGLLWLAFIHFVSRGFVSA